jgi:uncharacterized protein (DUF2141 family)
MLKTSKWYRNVFLAGVMSVATHAAAEEPAAAEGALTVQVWNVQNDKGQVGCSIYSKSDGFPSEPKKADAQMFVQQASGKATCTFKGIKPGTFAVSVMHDENKDGKLETSMVGRPKEWWGVSNDVPAERFGPPKYEKATFEFDGTRKTVKVKLRL